jgi:hypothetical protein
MLESLRISNFVLVTSVQSVVPARYRKYQPLGSFGTASVVPTGVLTAAFVS